MWMGVGFGFSEVCMYLSFALAFWYGARLNVDGKCSFEDTLWSQTNFFGMMMIGQAAVTAPDLSGSLVAATNIFRLLDRPSAIDPLSPSGDRPAPVHGAVACTDVGFAYPSRPDVRVLRGLSAAVVSGKSLALVGESGCGKSTVVALVLRFYDVTDGFVDVDALDVRAWHVVPLRSHLALVSQEPDLFSLSVRDNNAFSFPSSDGGTVVTDQSVQPPPFTLPER